MGLAHNSSGPKNARCLMVCRNLSAIKNIQKRGGVSAVAINMGDANTSNAPVAIQVPHTPGILGIVKARLVEMLLPYHPQVI
jgi:hypothetical protein